MGSLRLLSATLADHTVRGRGSEGLPRNAERRHTLPRGEPKQSIAYSYRALLHVPCGTVSLSMHIMRVCVHASVHTQPSTTVQALQSSEASNGPSPEEQAATLAPLCPNFCPISLLMHARMGRV